MIEAPSDSWSTLAVHLPEERACALTSAHVIASGLGRIWVDDPAHPSALASFTGGNLALVGRAENIRAGELWDLVGCLLEDWDRVFIDAQDGFAERLRDEVPGLHGWPRVAFELPESVAPERFESPEAISIRRLVPRDREALEGLGRDVAWISDTHGGPQRLASTGLAFGAFQRDRLVSVAASFFQGSRYEELAVITEHDCRGRGLSPACAIVLIHDIRSRSRIPCWGTTPSNASSLRVARKLGFQLDREEMHWLAGAPLRGSLELESR